MSLFRRIHSYFVRRRTNKKWVHLLDHIFRDLNHRNSRSAEALTTAFQRCAPFFYFSDKFSDYCQLVWAPPFILGRHQGYSSDYYFTMLFADDTQWKNNDLYSFERMSWSIYNCYRDKEMAPSWLNPDIDRLVPLKAQVEFLEGVRAVQQRILTSPSQEMLEKDRERSRALTSLLPYLEKESLSQHVWVPCPHCQGVSVVPPESSEALFSCTYCENDVVLTLENDSVVPKTYPFLLEEKAG